MTALSHAIDIAFRNLPKARELSPGEKAMRAHDAQTDKVAAILDLCKLLASVDDALTDIWHGLPADREVDLDAAFKGFDPFMARRAAKAVADAWQADLDASYPDWCDDCDGTGEVDIPAVYTGANPHSATTDECRCCEGAGIVPKPGAAA